MDESQIKNWIKRKKKRFFYCDSVDLILETTMLSMDANSWFLNSFMNVRHWTCDAINIQMHTIVI